MSIIKNLLMKKLSVFQEMEIAIALSDRIEALQKIVDKSKKYDIDCNILEQGIEICKSALSELGLKFINTKENGKESTNIKD